MNEETDIQTTERVETAEAKGSSRAASGSTLECPSCQSELDHNDTFGNLDHCLNAIGHPRGEWDRPRHPVKAGDIYRCPECDEWWHTYDGDGELRSGYPC